MKVEKIGLFGKEIVSNFDPAAQICEEEKTRATVPDARTHTDGHQKTCVPHSSLTARVDSTISGRTDAVLWPTLYTRGGSRGRCKYFCKSNF
jgi:hypothetical protein